MSLAGMGGTARVPLASAAASSSAFGRRRAAPHAMTRLASAEDCRAMGTWPSKPRTAKGIAQAPVVLSSSDAKMRTEE